MPQFYTFARKINKIAEFYTLLARKMPEFYIMFARKIFSGIFFLGGGATPLPPTPVPMTMTGPQVPYQLNPALGNRGWSKANYNMQLHSLSPEQPLGYLVKNRGRISYPKVELWQIFC